MSMYTQLLAAALDSAKDAGEERTSGEALARLLRSHGQLHAARSSHLESGWAPAAVANEVAYDVALIEFARRIEIECNVDDFDQPGRERLRLERALADRGIRRDVLDEPSLSAPDGN
jgi:hypothetical protein